jgi:hypothetical protein
MKVIVGHVTITEEVSQGLVDDLLCTAFEGACDWIEKIETPVFPEGAEYGSDVVSRGETVYVYAEGINILTLPAFIRGIRMHCENKPTTVAVLNEDHDGDDADCILQYALFGEVVYG